MNKKQHQKYGTKWSRNETILAFYLYCQLPFAKTKRATPQVIELSTVIGRTPSSVARKLGNFGTFDQNLADRGIKGLTHHSKLDKEIWDEFSDNWDSLVNVAQEIMSQYKLDEKNWLDVPMGRDADGGVSLPTTEIKTTTIARRGQGFFRRTVLSSYDQKCCVCGLDIEQLLIASHIIPWSIQKKIRLDPRNGLSLCVLHDKLYDRGLLTIDDTFRIIISPRVKKSTSDATQHMILTYQEEIISLPTKFIPNQEYLRWHYHNVFIV